MKYVFLFSFVILSALAITGCYTLNAVGTPADQTFSMSNNPGGEMVKHFSTTMTVHHFIFGLVTASDPDVAKALSDEVKAAGGSNVNNLKINYQMTFVNGLLNAITFGIYNPFTLTIEGDVIK
jgi:Bor protein